MHALADSGLSTLPVVAAEEDPGQVLIIIVVAALSLGFLILVVFLSRFIKLWIQAYMSKAGVRLSDLIGMYFRPTKMHGAQLIVANKIALVQAGIREIPTRELEAHYLAGGNVTNVTRAVIAADNADLPLDFQMARGIDLAGRNVFEAVQTSVNPRVIDVPGRTSGRDTIDAIATNGIQLKARARVTVRTNLKQLIGGATEETIIARVGEGIVSAIGSSETHYNVLENPDRISKAVLSKGLDSGTAFEILSIDIADVDVGENIGAKLQAEQAEADVRVARAKAEQRAALARAEEQEMHARTQRNRAEVVLAEAEIPRAIAQAFREGNLGLMDFYNLKNVQADTDMRTAIARGSKQDPQ